MSTAPLANAPASAASGVLSFLGLGGKPANKGVNAKKSSNVKALNASLNSPSAPAPAPAPVAPSPAPVAPSPAAATAARRRTRKQRGGARGMTMRLPGARNVLRVTGKTVRKLGRVGVYGLKKVGNGVHVVTGLLGGVLKKSRNVFRRLTKRRAH